MWNKVSIMSYYVKLCRYYVKLFFLLFFLLCQIWTIILPIMSNYLNYLFYYFTLFQGVTAQFTGAGRHTNLSYAQRIGGQEMRRASSAAGWWGQLALARYVKVFSRPNTIILIIFAIIHIISQVWPGLSSRYPRPTLCKATYNELKWYSKQLQQVEIPHCSFQSSICAV